MPSSVERDHLVREFCRNTGASYAHAEDVLTRNKWNLPNSYKEVEQSFVSSSRSNPAVPYPHKEATRHPSSRGGMEGGVGPAVTLDTRGVYPLRQHVVGSQTAAHPVEELKVALPPVSMAKERVIPIQVEGGHTMYQAQSTVSSTSSMARVSLEDKVYPSQPNMVAPGGSTGSQKSSSVEKSSTSQPVSTSHGPDSYPKLKRGFSSITENEVLVTAARSSVLQDIKEDSHSHMFMTFVLPDINSQPEPFRSFLNKELIESSTLHSLESAGRLNWWVQEGLCQRLYPMATSGDGNCLLHAASLSMWGIHDRLLTLRNALHHTLTSSQYKHNLYRRWRWQQTLVNQQSGLVFNEAEWQTEWDNILRLASPSPRSGPDSAININSCCDNPITSSSSSCDPVVYESLEEFHVFVLAHVLQRPIIVVADTILHDANGEALAPIPFGGIYLPLECHRDECYMSPLLLTYDAAHFSALVPMQHSQSSEYNLSVPLAIPVVDPQLQLLPLHFCHDPGAAFDWSTLNIQDVATEPCQQDKLNLLKAYMDILQLPLSSQSLISCSSLSSQEDLGGSNSAILKDKKKEGKQNVMAKQIGSLGKSVGKKLKHLSNNLAPSKGGKGQGLDGEKGQNMVVGGGLTQSAKVITAFATTGSGENEETVYCAKLSCESDDTREVFVNNYLTDAQRRFLQDQELKRQKGEEQRPRGGAPTLASISQGHTCRTAGCRNTALPDISLCDVCASHNQWQQGGTLDRSYSREQSQGPSQPLGYNTFPGRHKAPTGLPPSGPTSDEIYKYGKSKFYTPHPAEPPPQDSKLQVLRQGDRQQSLSTGNVARAQPAPRARSPPPDYDRPTFGLEVNPLCATQGCSFYGSSDTDNFCSGCYKKQAHLAKPEKTTRL